MATTALWAPNQAAIKQVETYTFSAPNSVGNTYIATINGKSVTYSSVSGDTATTVATALYELLNEQDSIAAEFTEIEWANPSDGVITATAKVAGTPFANVPGTSLGLVLSTGNGLSNGISTAHTTANASPSDINDAQNWLRVTAPAPGVRQLPQHGDDVVIANTSIPMLWNLDQLASVRFNTFTRYQTFEGTIGLPDNNPGGYTEWRATYFKITGPAGSVPAGGLQMVLGFDTGSGSGPTLERYDTQSQPTTLVILASGSAGDEYGVRWKGVHSANTFRLLGGVSLGIAMVPGEIATLSSCSMGDGSRLGLGAGVTWTAGSTLTMISGSAILNSAPATLTLENGARVEIATDSLTWATITARGGSSIIPVAGGTITNLTLETGSSLDKSSDSRALTITNSTIDGDSCIVNDPLNAITWTNATTVKQRVANGPFRFTGTRTVKVT